MSSAPHVNSAPPQLRPSQMRQITYHTITIVHPTLKLFSLVSHKFIHIYIYSFIFITQFDITWSLCRLELRIFGGKFARAELTWGWVLSIGHGRNLEPWTKEPFPWSWPSIKIWRIWSDQELIVCTVKVLITGKSYTWSDSSHCSFGLTPNSLIINAPTRKSTFKGQRCRYAFALPVELRTVGPSIPAEKRAPFSV